MTGMCLACGGTALETVLDLGSMPAADSFPLAEQPCDPAEAAHPLAMLLCRDCGLAQLERDDTVTEEPRGVEPRALRDQAADAVERVAAAGLLRGRTVREFGSPHGGSWADLLTARGFLVLGSEGGAAVLDCGGEAAVLDSGGEAAVLDCGGEAAVLDPGGEAADVVLDCFGLMHERDQRAAFARRAAATAAGGVLLVQYHPLHTIVGGDQWNALRHGHFAYYGLEFLRTALSASGMSVVRAWDFDLYGGTVLIAAVPGDAEADESVTRVLEREAPATDPEFVRGLQRAADRQCAALRAALEAEAARGARVYAYGAASRAVALLCRAGIDRSLLAAVADAAPGKQGRRMPGTDIPIISPERLVAADPDRVLLTVPDLLAEVAERHPRLDGRWFCVEDAQPVAGRAS